jgi:6-phosphogluconolactonase
MFYEFDNQEALTSSLTEAIATRLQQDLASYNHASLAVSGGNTPIPLFQQLSRLDLDWKKIIVTLVDERWVSNTHKDSNEKLVKDHLLCNKAAAATLIAHKNSATTPFEGCDELTAALAKIPGHFSVTILGMGEDGHTASFFPQADNILQALASDSQHICLGIDPKTAPQLRMTLTLPRILASKQIFVHITGEKKRQVYLKALEKGPIASLPIRAILKQNDTPVTVYWAP